MRWLIVLLVLLAPLGTPAFAQPKPDDANDLDISLVTFGPGEVYWERFGHNAIIVRDRASGSATSYNYGIFDFDEADFFLNFARGFMTYQIAANRADEDLSWYAGEGRLVVEQKLRFTPAQARTLRDFLEWNLLPENVRYRYDYYTSNCSTRVRDALDQALGGQLRKQLVSPSQGNTFRILTDSLTSPQPWLMAGLDAGLGPFADRRLSFWDDSFVPMQMMRHLRDLEVVDADGVARPLVVSETLVSRGRIAEPPALPPDLRWPFLGAGLALGLLLWLLGTHRTSAAARRSLSIIAIALSLACGLCGLVLLGLWGLTEHRSAWRNENLLLLNPLCLLLVPTWWRAARGEWRPTRYARTIALVIALLAGFALFAKVLPWFAQANLPWIVLLLPMHLALYGVIRQAKRISEQGGVIALPRSASSARE